MFGTKSNFASMCTCSGSALVQTVLFDIFGGNMWSFNTTYTHASIKYSWY